MLNVGAERWRALVAARGVDPAEAPMPMEFSPAIEAFAREKAGSGEREERLRRLHAALLDRHSFAFEYDKIATFTAKEAFESRKGNCVSFANLLIAMARALGFPLRAGLVLPRGSSEKSGDLILVYGHMVAVDLSIRSATTYDFYRERMEQPGELRLLDDMEVAAIALSNRGVAALREGDLLAARTLLERAVRLGPRLPDARSNLGIVLWRQRDIGAALAEFRKGLDVEPRRAALLHNLAALYVQLGRTAEARTALAAASLEEASPYLLVAKGDLELAGGDLAKARSSYKKAHARDPKLLEPLLGLARAERALGREKAVRKALEKAARLAPDDERVRKMRAVP